MRRMLVAIGLAATLPILSWHGRARADGGAEEAGADATAPKDTGPPPKEDTGAPPKDTGTLDTTEPPDVEAVDASGELGDVIIADGGESLDSEVPPSEQPVASADDGGGGINTVVTTDNCSVSTVGSDNPLVAGLALGASAVALGLSIRRRRRAR